MESNNTAEFNEPEEKIKQDNYKTKQADTKKSATDAPFSGKVRPNAGASQLNSTEKPVDSVPVGGFNRPSQKKTDPIIQPGSGSAQTGNGGPTQQAKKPEAFNPEMDNMTRDERESAAAQMANMLIKGYGFGCHQLNKLVLINEKKLTKLQREGKLTLSLPIPDDPIAGTTITIGELIKEYNSQADGTLEMSEKFAEEIKGPLTRILAKKGFGLSDEGVLLTLLATDVTVKGVTAAQLKIQSKSIIKMVTEATLAWQENTQALQRTQQGPAKPQQQQPVNPQTQKFAHDTSISDAEIIQNTPAERVAPQPEKPLQAKITVVEEVAAAPSLRKRGRPSGSKSKKDIDTNNVKAE